MPGKRVFNNPRVDDTNIHRNYVRAPQRPEFSLPPEAVQTITERDAIVAAIEVFVRVTEVGLKLPGRDIDRDTALLASAKKVLVRLS